MIDLEQEFQNLIDGMHRQVRSMVRQNELSKEDGEKLGAMIGEKVGWMSSTAECAIAFQEAEEFSEWNELKDEEAWASATPITKE